MKLGSQFRELTPSFRRYLLVGGFPETARIDDVSLCQRLLREDVVERVLKRDMTALFGVRNINELERLFIYICLHSGSILAVQTCADLLQTTKTTVSNHLELLEQANLIYRLPPADTSGKRVLKMRYKVYLVDAALRNAVLLRGEAALAKPEEAGAIVETTILRHLHSYYYRDTPEIAYWRDSKTEKEVDMIVKTPAYTIPVEVKYREDASMEETSGMAAYCLAEAPDQAYWVTKRDRDFALASIKGLKTRFLKIPAHIFAYLLGQAEQVS